MLRSLVFVVGYAALLLLSLPAQHPQLNSALPRKRRPCLRKR